jgi:hypothetical protein
MRGIIMRDETQVTYLVFKVYVHGWTYAAGAWMRRSGAKGKGW